MDDPASLFLLFFAETASVEFPTPISTILNLLLVIFLVLGNGFFVASEFALVAVRKSRIEALANEGSKAAERLLGLLNNLNAYISATQLGITLFSLGLGYVAEPAIVKVIEPLLISLGTALNWEFLVSPTLAHAVSFAIAFAFITFLHIVFGELAPKTAALELSERVSLIIALPMQIFYKIFYYPIRLLDWTGTKTVRLFGLRPSGEHGSSYTEDEIRQLVKLSQESGHLNEEERRLDQSGFRVFGNDRPRSDDPANGNRGDSRNFDFRSDRQSLPRTRLFASAGLRRIARRYARRSARQRRDAVSARQTANVQTRQGFEKAVLRR